METSKRSLPEGAKKIKNGHRREYLTDGIVTYKKIVTTELMGSIQFGLQQVIGIQGGQRSLNYRDRDLLVKDFEFLETLLLPKDGTENTPVHYYKDFQFQEYASFAFNNFRQLYGIDPLLFLSSLCSLPMKELSNPGRSGSIFYRTQDDNFICKTVFHKEAKFLQRLLPGYWINLVQSPKTYLPKFFGLYCYLCQTKNIRIIVMNNLLPSNITIHHIFDLKGSTKGRKLSQRERGKHSPVYKDLDFLDMYPEGIQLDCKAYADLTKTIESDCRVLESYGITDYSLLIGIHNQSLADKEGNLSDKECHTSPTSFPPPIVSSSAAGESVLAGYVKQSVSLNNTRLPFHAKNHRGEHLLIYLGIIDILQSFDLVKRTEHYIKSIVYDSNTVSAHHPGFYSKRFQTFINGTVFKNKVVSGLSAPLHQCSKVEMLKKTQSSIVNTEGTENIKLENMKENKKEYTN